MSSKNETKKQLKAFGLRVRQIRTKKGLTLEDVEAFGYPSWRHLQKIESGKNITLETLFRLASALKVDPKDLL